jgi:hypothetical protein
MSEFRRSVAVVATLAAVVALPATASAKTSVVSKPSVATVKTQVATAQTAVKRLKRAVRLDQSTIAKRQLKIARSQSATASRSARGMATRASTPAAAAGAAQALTIAGTQYDSLLETLTALVDDGTAQAPIVSSIPATIAGKAQIIEVLTSLLDDVPASVQPILASIIAELGAGDATEVVNLDNALSVGSLPATITGLVSQCLALATQAIQTTMVAIQGFLPMLPSGTQAPLGGILSQATSVGTLLPSLLSTVTGLIDTVLGSLPVLGGGSGGGLGGIFGGLLGGMTGGGAASVPGGIGNTISSLLGGLLGGLGGVGGTGSNVAVGSVPAVGGIVGTVTNLITSLLGGLLGGLAPAT